VASLGGTGGEGGPPWVTPFRGDTLMKMEIFLRLNLQFSLDKRHLKGEAGGNDDYD